MTSPESDAPRERSRLLTLVFTDLVDSVGLKTRLGDSEAGRLISTHHEALRKLCQSSEGREILLAGDGSFLTFETPSRAVEFALRLQDFHRGNQAIPPVRIGIHMGEVTESNAESANGNSIEISGLAVDLASRIQSLALERQILLSYSVFDNARQRLDNSEWSLPVEWRAHGRYIFKGSDMALDIFEVGLKGISEFKPPTGNAKAQRDVHGEEEETLGWRPAQGLEIPERPNWILIEKLGEGGFGDVWLAEHCKTRERHVIKFCYSSDRLRTLKREVTLFRLLKETLGDRNDIARVLDYQFNTTPFYLEMEFAGRHTLASWFEERGGVSEIPLQTRLEIVAQVCDAIAAAHSVGVLHKDIKPSNIMITESEANHPHIRMIDFGIGAVSDRHLLDDKGITATGLTEADSHSDYASSMTGTRLYMAPELIEGKVATTKSDIYSLGVLLYQMASGKLRNSLAFGWERDISDEILRKDIEACVDGIPENRVISAEELASRLRRLPERRAARKQTILNQKRLENSKKRRCLLYLGGILLTALLIIVVQYAANQIERANAQEKLRQRAEEGQKVAQQQTEKTQAALLEAQKAQYFGSIALAEASLRESRLQKVEAVLLTQTPKQFLHREWGWLLAQTAPEDMSIENRNIFDAQFTPDGNTIIAGSRNKDGKGQLLFFDASSGKRLNEIITNNRLVWNMDISPDGKYAVTASSDKVVTVVDLTSGTVIHKFKGNKEIVRDARFSPDSKWMASAGRDHKIRFWNTSNFKRAGVIRADTDRFTEIEFSPDSKYIATASLEGNVRVYETRSKKLVCDLGGHDERIVSICFLKNGHGVATAATEGITRIFPWPPPDGETTLSARLQIRSPDSYPSQVISSVDGESIFIGNDNGRIVKVDANTGKELMSVRVDQPLWKMSLCEGGKRLLSCARWSMRLIDVDRLDGISTVSEWTDETTLPATAIHMDVKSLPYQRDQTWSGDKIWRTTSGLSLVSIGTTKTFLVQSNQDVYSPDRSQHIKIDYETFNATITSTANSEELTELNLGPVIQATYSSDGKLAAIVLDGIGTAIFNTKNWQQQAFIPLVGIGPTQAVFTPDLKSIIVSYIDGQIVQYDANTGVEQVRLLESGNGMPLDLDISPAGAMLAVGLDNDRALVIDIKSQKLISKMFGHVRYAYKVKFSPDLSRLTTLSRDGTVKLWDVETGRELITLFNLTDGEIPLGIYYASNNREIHVATSTGRIVTTEYFPWDLNEYPNPEEPLSDRIELWKRRQRVDPALTMEDISNWRGINWWAHQDSNLGPAGYEPAALTN